MLGALVSLNLVAWISFGTQAALANGKIQFPIKPVSVEGCPDYRNNNTVNFTIIIDDAVK
jgi:sodium-coupled monocarboxylate transporter 8/12